MSTRGYCLFCLESVQSIGHLDTTETFFKCLQNYTRIDILGTLLEELKLSKISPLMVLDCCKNCQQTVKEFCTVYQKIKNLERQLGLKLDNLVNSIDQSDKSAYKWQRSRELLANIFHNDMDREIKCKIMIREFRENIQTGRNKLTKSDQTQSEESYLTTLQSSTVRKIIQQVDVCSNKLSERGIDDSMETDDCAQNQGKCDNGHVNNAEEPSSVTSVITEGSLPTILQPVDVCRNTLSERGLECFMKTDGSADNQIKCDDGNINGGEMAATVTDNFETTVVAAGSIKLENNDISSEQDEQVDFPLDEQSINLEKLDDKIDSNKTKCSYCERSFISRLGHERHVILEHYEQFVTCSLCKKLCYTEKKLKKHMKIQRNLDEYEWECNVCQKKFPFKKNLNKHTKSHTSPDEWEWECKVCQKKFLFQRNLNKHMKTHVRLQKNPPENISNDDVLEPGKI